VKTILRISLLATVVAIAGCASAPAEKPAGEFDFAGRGQGIIVQSVGLAPDVAVELEAAEREALALRLRDELVAVLPVADGAGNTRRLRLEVTVTGIDPASPTLNVLTTALLFVPLDRGGIDFEARFFEGEGTGPIAVQTRHHSSTPLELSGSFSRYGHAIGALRDWGASLAQAMDPT
jgi:hypothetical protein